VSATTIDPLGPEDRDSALWTGAALLVAAVHVALVAAYLLLRPEPAQRAEAPAVDVAFMPAADKPAPATPETLPAEPVPPVEQSNLAPPMDEPVTSREAVAEPEPEHKTELPPAPESAPPAAALTTPEPLVPPAPPDDAVVVAPPPEVTEPPPQPPKPVTAPERPAAKPAAEEDKAARAKREQEKAEKQKKEAKEKEARKIAQQRSAAASASQAVRMASAPNAGIESEGARAGQANWNSEVEAQIRRAAAYPADGGGASGTARVSVTIDRNGRLVSHRLAGSSGSPSLDRAAMAIVERAQPFPHFPPGMNQAQVGRTIPLHLRPR